MAISLMKLPQRHRESGLSLMETIIGVLVALIFASIVLHLARLGFAMYELNSATTSIAHELERARQLAVDKNQKFAVMFQTKEARFGMDRNGNGKLDNAEAIDLPSGVTLSEDAIIVFSRSGKLASDSKQPRIVVSNDRNSRKVSVSSLGAVEVD